MEATIEIENLQHVLKEKNGTLTISIDDLKLYESQVIYLSAPNGVGKTTLLRLLALQLDPNKAGQIRILGKTVSGLRDRDKSDLRGGAITYIPQEHLSLAGGSPFRIIRDVLYNYDGFPIPEAGRRATEALNKIKLAREKFYQPIRNFSGGEKARVAVAKAYARERAICLGDEVLRALDDRGQMLALQVFQELARRHKSTIVIIVHEPGSLKLKALKKRKLIRYFDRVIIMNRIKIREGEYISKIIHNKSIREIFPGDPTVPVLIDESILNDIDMEDQIDHEDVEKDTAQQQNFHTSIKRLSRENVNYTQDAHEFISVCYLSERIKAVLMQIRGHGYPDYYKDIEQSLRAMHQQLGIMIGDLETLKKDHQPHTDVYESYRHQKIS